MGMLKEFKDFALRGNVVDMAVGVVIGAAFGKIVSSLVSHVIMPPLGYLLGGIDFSQPFHPSERYPGLHARRSKRTRRPGHRIRRIPECSH